MMTLCTGWALHKRSAYRPPLSSTSLKTAVDPDAYRLHLYQSGLGLPDRDFYTRVGPAMEALREAYQHYLSTIFQMISPTASPETVTSQVSTVFSLESQIAKHHWTKVQNRDREKTYNKTPLGDLKSSLPHLSFGKLLKGAAVPKSHLKPDTPIIVNQPTYLSALDTEIKKNSVADWKAYPSRTLG